MPRFGTPQTMGHCGSGCPSGILPPRKANLTRPPVEIVRKMQVFDRVASTVIAVLADGLV